MDKVRGLAGEGIGQVGLLDDGLSTAENGVVGIVVRFVIAHVGRVDQVIAHPAALLATR